MSKKTIAIIVVVTLVAIIAGVGIGIYFFKGSSEGPKEIVKHTLTLEDMFCNIKDSKRILKLRATIESTSEESIVRLEEKQFLARDEINKVVRNKTDEELQGKEGQIQLQKEIKEELIRLFNDDSITNVYFDDFIIQ